MATIITPTVTTTATTITITITIIIAQVITITATTTATTTTATTTTAITTMVIATLTIVLATMAIARLRHHFSTEIVKSWKVKNSGDIAWPEGCVLKMQSGRFGVSPFEGDPSLINVAVPPVGPGQEYIIETQLTTPSESGRYRAFWRMTNPAGKCFGHRLWIDVTVSEEVVIDESAIISNLVPATEEVSTVSEHVQLEESEAEPIAVSGLTNSELVDDLVADAVVASIAPGEDAVESDDGVVVGNDIDSDDSFSIRSEASSEDASDTSDTDASDVSSESSNDSDESDDSSDSDSDANEVEDRVSEASVGSTISETDEAVAAVLTQDQNEQSEQVDIVEELYNEALAVLESMGFGDKEVNRRVLAEWGGNITDAVESLLKEE
ncbi:hypothetical protein P43SY_003349 [Pythium insidiosum]|uniref:UBA domain-containing protein n=1 Tax=Pythium insidiosum TaxID=114742 RepID=A0AAD5Q3L9_PYTIN|nr:hypothetical protein P43SY_003349 [Pythium insidiosum]